MNVNDELLKGLDDLATYRRLCGVQTSVPATPENITLYPMYFDEDEKINTVFGASDRIVNRGLDVVPANTNVK
jgi:hypothetical protein